MTIPDAIRRAEANHLSFGGVWVVTKHFDKLFIHIEGTFDPPKGSTTEYSTLEAADD